MRCVARSSHRPESVILLALLGLLFACADTREELVQTGPTPLDGGSVLDASLGANPVPIPGQPGALPPFGPPRGKGMLPNAVDGGVDLYPPGRPLDIELSVAPSDWDRIRLEGRTLNQSYSGCRDGTFDYTFVNAAARVEGEIISGIGLRKKGYLGSISVVKPSLRLDFGEFTDDQTFHGHKDLTLNNSRSDDSLLHQCLAYRVFERAGIPAPRCAFTRVHLNGSELGMYVNVEPVKKPLLRRYFASDEGNLYEGNSGADFRPGHLDLFEKKTNEKDPDRSELVRIAEALESKGAEMLARLDPLLDVDQFLRYWAVETIVGHWDGYAGDANNFFVYWEPTTRKVTFLPWGTDGTFSRTHPFLGAGQRPAETYAYARLPNRLYEYDVTRARYLAALRSVLESAWNESELLAEIDRMQRVVGSYADARAVMALRTFVMNRRAQIEREINGPYVPWTLGERQLRKCNPDALTPIRGTFVTTWGFTDVATPATTLEIVLDGRPQMFTSVASGVGPSLIATLFGTGPSMRFSGTRADGSTVNLQFSLGATPPSGPGEVVMHGYETYGTVTITAGRTSTLVGYIGEGKLVFEELSPVNGGLVRGRLEGELVQTRALPTP